MANGLAFSTDATENECHFDQARYVLEVQLSLKDAGIVHYKRSYYCGHEEWVEKESCCLMPH